jgi:hypothetical protein
MHLLQSIKTLLLLSAGAAAAEPLQQVLNSKRSSPFDEDFEQLAVDTLNLFHVPGTSIGVVDGDDTWAIVSFTFILCLKHVLSRKALSICLRKWHGKLFIQPWLYRLYCREAEFMHAVRYSYTLFLVLNKLSVKLQHIEFMRSIAVYSHGSKNAHL